MKRNCDVCGVEYEAKRPNSRYHSDKCRKRAQRGGATVVVDLTTAPAVAERPAGAVEAAAHRELEQAGRLDTALGRTCLTLARRLDNPGVDTGSAVASVAARFDDLMAKATKGAGAATAPDKLRDELAERRRRHA